SGRRGPTRRRGADAPAVRAPQAAAGRSTGSAAGSSLVRIRAGRRTPYTERSVPVPSRRFRCDRWTWVRALLPGTVASDVGADGCLDPAVGHRWRPGRRRAPEAGSSAPSSVAGPDVSNVVPPGPPSVVMP